MSFLEFFKKDPKNVDPLQEVQYSLLDDSPEIVPETRQLTGAIVNQRFNSALERHGVDRRGHGMATKAVTQEMMGCTVDELYEQTGGKKGRRNTLPLVAQEALALGEIGATHELNQAEPLDPSEPQYKKNTYAIDLAVDGARKAKKALSWWT